MSLFRNVEVEWIGAAGYLRSILPVSQGNDKVTTTQTAAAADRINPEAAKRKRGRHPKKLEETKDAMRTKIKEGTLTPELLKKKLEKELQAMFGVSRSTCRDARKAILSESEFVGNSIPDK